MSHGLAYVIVTSALATTRHISSCLHAMTGVDGDAEDFGPDAPFLDSGDTYRSSYELIPGPDSPVSPPTQMDLARVPLKEGKFESGFLGWSLERVAGWLADEENGMERYSLVVVIDDRSVVERRGVLFVFRTQWDGAHDDDGADRIPVEEHDGEEGNDYGQNDKDLGYDSADDYSSDGKKNAYRAYSNPGVPLTKNPESPLMKFKIARVDYGAMYIMLANLDVGNSDFDELCDLSWVDRSRPGRMYNGCVSWVAEQRCSWRHRQRDGKDPNEDGPRDEF